MRLTKHEAAIIAAYEAYLRAEPRYFTDEDGAHHERLVWKSAQAQAEVLRKLLGRSERAKPE